MSIEVVDVEGFLAELPRLDRGQLLAIEAAWESTDPAARAIAWTTVQGRAVASGREKDLERGREAIVHWASTPEAITGQESGTRLDLLLTDLRRRAAPALIDAAAAVLLGDALDEGTRDVLLSPWRSRAP